MDIDQLINRYLLAAAEWSEAQERLGWEQSAVELSNRAADEMRHLATEVGAAGAPAVRTFSQLLDEARNGVQSWAAFHVLEVMKPPPDIVERAFAVLESLAPGEGITAVGTRMRLHELRAQYGRPNPNSTTA
jgi:hypothetical protein